MNTQVKNALLANAKIFREFGVMMDDPNLRDISYQYANDFETYINELWDYGFTVEELIRRFREDERNSTERDS